MFEYFGTVVVIYCFVLGLAAKKSWGWINAAGNEKAKEAAGQFAGKLLKKWLG